MTTCIYQSVTLLPRPLGNFRRIYVEAAPQSYFIAGFMELPMVDLVQRYRKLVADLHSDRPRLSEPQMMSVTVDQHPYDTFLQLEETYHRTTRIRRPQSNGIVER